MSPGAPDARLSNYRLERPLGSGGMGSVYLARDLALDRDVAIKFITPDKAEDASARHRLIREARAAAALDHPNICGVHEVIVEPDGRAAIVMQYVEGETLADILRRGPLEVRFALTIAADITRALVAAHKRGIIHRDIKPQNIIVTPEKQAKLLDFGVARQHEIAATHGADTTTILTSPGVIIGTPAYMSPEQAQQLPIDGRSDLFSLGAVLYECLTGKRPFTGRSSIDVLGAVLHHEPPEVSSLRPELTEQHDEVVRRLLAKHPDDRFKSADELLGALLVFSRDTSRTTQRQPVPSSRSRRKVPQPLLLGGVAVAIMLAAFAVWRWSLPESTTTPEAAGWYRRGTEAIRDGAYHSGRLALNEAIRADPKFPPFYIRLAEAETELDEAENAHQALLTVATLVSSESRLPPDDRKRIQAVRALMRRDVDGAVRAYSELTNRRPDDAGAWLDLGRVQDAAALSTDALVSYEKAISIDPQYAPAHLRRASILAFEGQRDNALAAFSEAGRLYRALANQEGEIETLIRLGAYLNGLGELREARAALERARDLAGKLQSRAQEIRAQLHLSSVTASEGKFGDAEKMASAAVDSALREGLETVAADGLVDLGNTLFLQKKRTEADAHFQRAIQLAKKRNAQRIMARASLQSAALLVDADRPSDAIATARGWLEYVQSNRYRRYELNALAIMARAHERLGEFVEARALAEQSLRTATAIKDDAQAGEALENLAGQSNAMGALTDALEYRARGMEIHRRQNDLARLPFDLTNRAELLIRLGRPADADRLLKEVDTGIAQGVDAYKQRERRVRALRALSAATRHDRDDVIRHAHNFPLTSDGKEDSNSYLATVLLEYAQARANPGANARRPSATLGGSTSSAPGREVRYWDLAARLAANDADAALSGVEETLGSKGATVSYEFEWRVAAIGAAAARQVRDVERQRVFSERAQRALGRLRNEWKSDVASYEARPDLSELRRKAGLN